MTTLAERRIDRYRTRTDEPAPLIRRTDPAVWGKKDSPVLGRLDADGYAVLDALLSPAETAELAAGMDRLESDRDLRDDERVVIEKKADRVRSVFEVHRISPAVADLVRDERLAGLARRVLGSEVYVHQSRVNYMPGFDGAGFYWHSDFETWHAEDGMPLPRAVSLSIALTDNLPYNGSLMVIPGSHRFFVPCRGKTPDEHYRESLREQRIGVPSEEHVAELARGRGIVQFTGAPGSALLFDSNVMHGSANNITPFRRSNIFVVFNSVENALEDPFAAAAPRPAHVAARDFTPVR
ncbi:ectoine hydroxylase [Amycolatopsis sp. VS8301801F10]|uniref:ectoine hydroxylase n=1 Tax=Amycolatopsis sp. VS8301801F10 TaxID=2652442 RepID=UPI0038FC0CB9